VSKEKPRQDSSEKAKEKEKLPEQEALSEEEWRRVLDKTRQLSASSEETSEEESVLVMPLTEEAEKSLEELAQRVVERLSSKHVWIAKRGRYGFMFVVPKGKEEVQQWSEEWAGFAVDWCREMLLHMVSTRTLVMLDPFCELRPDRHKAVRVILDSLVKEDLGRWIDEAEGIVRVTWKADDEWAAEIRTWALETGRTTFTLFKLKEYRKDLATLPKSELRAILDRLVNRKQARWLDREQEVLEVLV
jgi:hypothetical protein